MEICFIPDKDYAKFIEENTDAPIPKGNYVNAKGEILGQHQGITHYTIGQRKGLNLAMGHPVFVSRICPETNEVVIGENEDIFHSALYCSHLNAMSVTEFADGMEVTAKIRYNHRGATAVLQRAGDDRLLVRFWNRREPLHPDRQSYFIRTGMLPEEALSRLL